MTTTDRHLHPVRVEQPTPLRPLVREQSTDDSVRWLVGVMVELSRRFIGHAIKRYPEFGSSKHQCPKCGERS